MHLGSSSSSSPHSVVFQFLPPNSCRPSVPLPSQTLGHRLYLQGSLEIVMCWWPMWEAVCILPNWRKSKAKAGEKSSCPGYTYSFQAGENNLFSLCLWSLPRNRNRILFACSCCFSYYCFPFNFSQTKFSFLLCEHRPQALQWWLWLSAAPAANPHHSTFLLDCSTSPFSAFPTAQALPGIRLGCYIGQLNVISCTSEFLEAEFLCRALISEAGRVFNTSDNQWVRNAPGLQLLESGAGTGEIAACTSLVLAFSWLFYHPAAGFLTLFPDFWSDYKSSKLTLTGNDYARNYV